MIYSHCPAIGCNHKNLGKNMTTLNFHCYLSFLINHIEALSDFTIFFQKVSYRYIFESSYDIDSLMYYDYNGIKHPSVYVLIDSKGRIRSGYNENNKPIGFYDGTSASEIKQLVKDVGILDSETKRNR